jgi:DNA-binding NarL/FixJ family response regulator
MQDTPLHIAIADDNRPFREGIAQGLRTLGMEVVMQAGDGEQFVERLEALEAPPEVVLMDIDMPRLNGIEAVRLSKARFPSIYFIMLTVFDDEQRLFEAIQAGACGYLLKDTPLAQVHEAVQEAALLGGGPMSPSMARKALRLLQSMPSPAPSSSPQLEYRLTEREAEVLERLVKGESYTHIADILCISPHTVRKHIARVYEKLHVRNKAGAVQLATKKRWFLLF